MAKCINEKQHLIFYNLCSFYSVYSVNVKSPYILLSTIRILPWTL